MKKSVSRSLIALFALGLAVTALPVLANSSVPAKKVDSAAPTPPERSADVDVLDPFEPVNRAIFGLNEVVDLIVIRPVVEIWRGLMPQPVQTVVANVFNNLDDVFAGTSQALQGHGHAAATDFGRVLINTTVGIGGAFDVASGMGMTKVAGDFGQTLGVWGLPAGPYLVLPLLGPSSFRETAGRVGRYYSDPRTYLDPDWRYSLMATEYVQARADGQYAETLVDVSSFDKYVFVRNLYMQRRAAMVRDSLESGQSQQ